MRMVAVAAWKDDLRGRAGRDGHVHIETLAVLFPADLDRAVRALMARLGPGESATRHRRDAESLVAGFEELEAGDVLVQEGDDGAFAVVVQRGVRVAVGVDATPLLPDGGGAAVDHDEPGGFAVLEQQVVGDVEVSGVGEDREKERGGEESGCEVGARRADELDQPGG